MDNKLETISNLFEGKEIRSIWNAEKEEYFFSIVDVIAVLTDSKIPSNYWSDLKRKLKEEGSQLHENIVQLKMKAKDGKFRETDTLDTKGILRLREILKRMISFLKENCGLKYIEKCNFFEIPRGTMDLLKIK